MGCSAAAATGISDFPGIFDMQSGLDIPGSKDEAQHLIKINKSKISHTLFSGLDISFSKHQNSFYEYCNIGVVVASSQICLVLTFFHLSHFESTMTLGLSFLKTRRDLAVISVLCVEST